VQRPDLIFVAAGCALALKRPVRLYGHPITFFVLGVPVVTEHVLDSQRMTTSKVVELAP
jgi:hypothetical protein